VESVDPTTLSFEAALERLETIVESMESGDVPLADLLTRFEEGSRLLKACEERLRDAELRIDLLKRQKDGATALADFSSDRSAP
jgi:exodeoxyribonuclease VII small subunit